MEDRAAENYITYNSTINDGRRIRRMRRTELSFEKVSNLSPYQYKQYAFTSRNNRGSFKRTSSNSQPKVQQRQSSNKKHKISKQDNLKHVKNQYFVTITPNLQNVQQKIGNKKLQNISSGNISTPKLNSFQSIAKNMIEQLSNNDADKWSDPFQVSQKSKDSKKISKQEELIQVINNYNEYGFQAQPLKSNLTQKNSNHTHSKKMQQLNSSQLSKSIKSKNSKIQIQKQNRNAKTASKIFKQKIPSGFQDADGQFPNQSKMIEVNQPFSKLKLDNLQNPLIITSSNAKKQNWKDAIKSLTEISQLDNNSNMENSKKANMLDSSKKIQLKIQSMREDNMTQPKIDSTQKNSWKHLPLTSKEPSQRKSFDSLSNVQISSLKGVLQYIQIHEYLVSLVDEFKETVQNLPTNTTQKQVICFLLERKHFLQKNNMIKALKGGKNIFTLTTFQIPNQYLKKYLQTPQIKKIVNEMQQMNNQLFKNFQKKYHKVKQTYRGNNYIKLQTPNDNFSKQIIRLLEIQLTQLNNLLQSAKTQEQQEKLQNDIFDTMEMIFLISELNGRKVKKIQFYEEISDFEEYYNQHEMALKDTYEYFKSLK